MPQLLRYLRLTTRDGRRTFTLAPRASTTVRLSMRMHFCETLSARAGSFASAENLRTARAGVLHRTVHVALPEEVHTGSPREAYCPDATATSRPPG